MPLATSSRRRTSGRCGDVISQARSASKGGGEPLLALRACEMARISRTRLTISGHYLTEGAMATATLGGTLRKVFDRVRGDADGGDGELLTRYRTLRDQDAFGSLVRRH